MKNVFEKEMIRENILTESLQIRKKYRIDVEVNEKYDKLSIAMMFFCFAFAGWIIEVIWMFAKQGIIVNRGTLVGPWLPIYGFSCIFILMLFSSDSCKRITRNPFYTFIAIMILCSVGEYITSLILEVTYGLRWWDYSNELFNINGRVCLENSVLFGIGGCLCLYLIGPALNKTIKKIPKKAKIAILTILIFVFVVDNIYCIFNPHTGLGITENQIFINTLNLF